MDTLSHALVGLAVAGLSGHQPTLHDPIYIAAMLGAQAPDFDIIAQVRGDMAYLRQHRSFSHSIPGITGWALAISLAIRFFMPQAAFAQVLVWSFAGALSHIVIDYFNTHGVAILWPFRRDRKSCPLLNVFDPVLLLLMLMPYASRPPMLEITLITFTLLIFYILAKYFLRQRATKWLLQNFFSQQVTRIWVMPCLKHLFYWDFVVETDSRILNGRIGLLYPVMEIRADFPKLCHSLLTAQAQKSSLGEFFRIFSPYIYFEEHPAEDSHRVTIYDLRYFADQHFIHSATIVFNRQNAPCESYIHSLGRTIKIQTADNINI